MNWFRKGTALLVAFMVLLLACARADGLTDWMARYNTAAASAGLAPIADAQAVAYGAYAVVLEEGALLAATADDSTIGGVIITGISSQDRLALVCGAALYACDSTLTVETAMEKMKAFIRESGASSERFETAGGWVYMLETDNAETIVCLMREELFASFASQGMDFPSLPKDEQPAAPSETPLPGGEAPVSPEATPNPVLHKI